MTRVTSLRLGDELSAELTAVARADEVPVD
jgi:hypothetical protein